MPSKTAHTYSRRTFLLGMAALGLAGLFPARSAMAFPGYHETSLFMGTIVRIDIASCPVSLGQDACAAAFAEGKHLEALLTRHNACSPLGVLNSQGSLSDVPQELLGLLDLSADVHAISGGAFDPTILPVLLALENGSVSKAELLKLRSKIGFSRMQRGSRIRLQDGMAVTLDGIAKGYIAQCMSDVLTRAGCASHIVNAGGDIVARGLSYASKPWRVAIEDPAKQGRYPSVLHMSNRSLATSGTYERTYSGGNGSHLVDPARDGRLLTSSVSVLAPQGAQADALATAFSVMDPRLSLAAAQRLPGVDAFIVLADGSTCKTAGWPA